MNMQTADKDYSDAIPKLGFFAIATQKSIVLRASKIAAVVGVILAVLNHGDRVLTGQFDLVTFLKIVSTFLVPYCVSTYSSVLAVRERTQSLEPLARSGS